MYLTFLFQFLRRHVSLYLIVGFLGICFSSPIVQAASFDPSTSPFADKPADSYSNFKDAQGKDGVLIWGQAPFTDFGSREVQFIPAGSRPIRPIPAPGIHPRIFFGPDDLPDVRKRLKETRCGQEAWKNILCWTEMMKGKYDDKADYAQPDKWNGGYGGLHGRVPLFRLGIKGKRGYNHSEEAADRYEKLIAGDMSQETGFYWNVFSLEAFRCLIENDEPAAADLAKAVVTAIKIDQAARDEALSKKKLDKPPQQPVGGFQLAFVYDFLFNWLTPAQRDVMHDELALGTWSHDNYGTFNTAESARSNWATFSYWLYEVLAIEGEPGFNDLKVHGIYRGWHDLLTYGWYQSGATYEGEAKNQIGMDGVLLFAAREKAYGFDNLCNHPYLQAYATKFLPESINPMQTGFNKYDLLGGSRAGNGGFSVCDVAGLKYMLPENKVIDWIFRKSVGENYEEVPDRPDGYYNGLLFFAIYASDFDPANDDPKKLDLANTFFCGERSLLMTRSSWDKDAMMLNMHTRTANGGHPFADRNSIMVAGSGRIWSPNGYANFRTCENSVVCIDGKSQNESTPGRMVDFQDGPDATFAVGDAKYCWDWTWKRLEKKNGYYTKADIEGNKVEIPEGAEPEKHSQNDFAFTKLSYAYLNKPMFELPDWIAPKGALSPIVRVANYPVQRAFRTAGLIRGTEPYALIVDDIQKDSAVHHYDWTLSLEPDIQIAKINVTNDHEMDITLTGADPDQKVPRSKEPLPSAWNSGDAIPVGQPMLLIRVLNLNPAGGKESASHLPEIVELPNIANPAKYQKIRRLIIPSDTVAPDFKVLLFTYHQGATLPTTKWNQDRSAVTVTWPGQEDTIAFSPTSTGKTNVIVTRSGKPLASVTNEIKALE